MAQGGVLFRLHGELHFVPASIAIKVIPTPETARIPGAPPDLRGVALVDGDMIPVIELAPSEVDPDEAPASGPRRPSGAMLVCAVLGERIGLVGIELVATGRFEPDPETGEMRFGAETAHTLDVGGLIPRVRDGRWPV